MTDVPGYFPTPTHLGNFVCAMSDAVGVPLDPARLRSWHTRSGLNVGTFGAERRQWRRYSDFDVLSIIIAGAISNFGIDVSSIVSALPAIRRDVEWAVRAAVTGRTEAEIMQPDDDVFVVATRSPTVTLSSDSRPAALERAGQFASLSPTPVLLLNISTIAERMRAAMVASPDYLKDGDPE